LGTKQNAQAFEMSSSLIMVSLPPSPWGKVEGVDVETPVVPQELR